jgi:hypothetical protein
MAIANKVNATAMSTNRAKVCIYLPLVEGRQRMSFSPTATTRERTPDGRFDSIYENKYPQQHDEGDDCYDITHHWRVEIVALRPLSDCVEASDCWFLP